MTQRDTPWKLIRAGRLIDGRGGPPIENGAVLVQESRIQQMGPANTLRVPEGVTAEESSYPEGTLLPGLIDVHTHTNFAGDGTHVDDRMKESDDILLMQSILNARIALESGVTTMRENGAKNHTSFSMREGIRRGLSVGPRLVLCGRPVTITGGHCWHMGSEADGVDGVRKAVRQLIKEGADYIKVMATGGTTRSSDPYRPAYTLEELTVIVDEAHRFGKLVGAHCRCTQGIINALDAGVDMLIHCQFYEADGTAKFWDDVAERIARAEVWVNPTLHVARSRAWRLQQKAEIVGLTDAEEARLKELEVDLKTRVDVCRRLISAGARMVTGTDCGWGDYPFGQVFYETELLVQASLTPMQGVLSVTRDAAQAIGVAEIVGTLEADKEADIVVVQGNPASDIMALANVVAVFQGGTQVK